LTIPELTTKIPGKVTLSDHEFPKIKGKKWFGTGPLGAPYTHPRGLQLPDNQETIRIPKHSFVQFVDLSI